MVYEAGADDASGGSSARGVDSISQKENLQRVASSAGVEASDVSFFVCLLFFLRACAFAVFFFVLLDVNVSRL